MRSSSGGLAYHHVDVFSRTPLSGNGLVVYPDARGVAAGTMLRLTQEMKQFESIFLEPTDDPSRVRARIFTVDEELDFAGHPVLGAAAVLHEREARDADHVRWTLLLARGRAVEVTSARAAGAFTVSMDQGAPVLGAPLGDDDRRRVAAALDLTEHDLDELPVRVASTGLPYLIVPVRTLERARVVHPSFEALLAGFGAKFAYLLDAAACEGRSWDNVGRSEDPATGSAAGPAAAYLSEAGRAPRQGAVVIRQGRFVGRPSEIHVTLDRSGGGAIARVRVRGDVAVVARGEVDRRALDASV